MSQVQREKGSDDNKHWLQPAAAQAAIMALTIMALTIIARGTHRNTRWG